MRRRFKKGKASPVFKNMKKWFFQKTAAITVAAVFLLVSFVLCKALLYRSDYFRLRDIEVNNIVPDGVSAPNIKYDQLLNHYRGRNIFNIDLKEIAGFFQKGYPDAKDIRVNIVLPDKVTVDIKCRWPVATLGGDRGCFVDEDGYILSASYGVPQSGLPVIEGINSRYIGRTGKKISLDSLTLALNLLKDAKNSKYISKIGLVRINAHDPAALSFNLANGVEVRIGRENFKGRLKVLEKTLRDPRLAIDRIEYIDVRFGDAVIGPK